MKYKVMALDIDGTLTNSEKVITEKTRKALFDFQEKGGKIILASGRPIPGIRPHAEALRLHEYGGYILAYNGGCVIDCRTDDIIFRDTLEHRYISEICSVIEEYPVGINTYEGDNLVVGHDINRYTEIESRINGMPIKFVEDFPKYVDFEVNKCLLQGEPEQILELEGILSEKYRNRLGIFKSEPYFLEIVPKGIDKALSIDRLLKKIDVKTEECVACGDGFNDISMLRYAGLGVAMDNASDTVKEAADFITLSNDSDGIAHLLEEIGQD